VADDIYEYFGGSGGTREVEPIEEDSGEFEQGLGQEKKDDAKAEGADSAAAADTEDIFARLKPNRRSIRSRHRTSLLQA